MLLRSTLIMLNKIKFSDLWLESDGTACIKGAGGGSPEEVHNVSKESFQELYEAIVEEERELKEKGEISGKE